MINRIYLANIVPAQEQLMGDRMIVFFFLKFPCLECSWINLKPLTFTFFKFKVPNFKQFFYGTLHCIGTGNMSESYWEAKAVLDNVKISAWSYFKFWVSGEEIDKSYVHCICVRCFEKIGEYSAAACASSYLFGSFFRAGYHHQAPASTRGYSLLGF